MWFDTETTGLPKHRNSKDSVQPKVIEFGAVITDENGKELDDVNLLIDPREPLEAIITKITGLTDSDLAGQPTFADSWPVIKQWIESCDAVVAHNLPFDSTLIELGAARLGETVDWPDIQICTVQEFTEYYGYRPKLTQLYEDAVGEKLAQTHRATDDVRAMIAAAKELGVLHAISAVKSSH